MSQEVLERNRLRVTAEADPGALQRILSPFQNLNILPRKVVVELLSTDTFHVEIDLAGVSSETVRTITAKIREIPCILNAYSAHL